MGLVTLVRVFSGNVKVQMSDGHHYGPRVKRLAVGHCLHVLQQHLAV